VRLIGEAVVDWYSSVRGEILDDLLAEPPIFDGVRHAPEHAGCIFHGLLVDVVAAARPQIGYLRALIVGGYLGLSACEWR